MSREQQSRRDAKKRALSFRPKGEIFLRSLGFAQDDGPQPGHLAPFASLREDSFFVLVVFFVVILVFLFKFAALSHYANRGKSCNALSCSTAMRSAALKPSYFSQ